MNKLLTLCLIHEPPRLLLGLKKRGFGAGLWNGFGGKLQPGESIEDAARRECAEECGIRVKELTQCGHLEFEFKGDPEIMDVHVFRVGGYDGEPVESEEMRPQWFDTAALPYDSMWADDRHWMPLFLAGKDFRGKFLFDGPDKIVSVDLKEVPDIRTAA